MNPFHFDENEWKELFFNNDSCMPMRYMYVLPKMALFYQKKQQLQRLRSDYNAMCGVYTHYFGRM